MSAQFHYGGPTGGLPGFRKPFRKKLSIATSIEGQAEKALSFYNDGHEPTSALKTAFMDVEKQPIAPKRSKNKLLQRVSSLFRRRSIEREETESLNNQPRESTNQISLHPLSNELFDIHKLGKSQGTAEEAMVGDEGTTEEAMPGLNVDALPFQPRAKLAQGDKETMRGDVTITLTTDLAEKGVTKCKQTSPIDLVGKYRSGEVLQWIGELITTVQDFDIQARRLGILASCRPTMNILVLLAEKLDRLAENEVGKNKDATKYKFGKIGQVLEFLDSIEDGTELDDAILNALLLLKTALDRLLRLKI